MGQHAVIKIFAIFSFMMWYASVFATKRLIQHIGFHEKYWPKQYVMPNRKVRKLFGLKKKEIPKWCYYKLFMSFVPIVLFLVSTILYLSLSDKSFVAGIFLWIYCIVMALDALYVLIYSIMYG